MRSTARSFANIVEFALRSASSVGAGRDPQPVGTVDKGMCVLIDNRHKIKLWVM